MATKEQVNTFIQTLAAYAAAEAKKRTKWVLPSVCIAQAALETGWGTSALMTDANAYFGIKATSAWKGKVYNSKTNECYDGVTFTEITACFRAYDSLADSVADYYDFITGKSRYAGAVNNTSAESAIKAIHDGGYATDPDYADKVMDIINRYDLTQYDDISAPAEETKVEGIVLPMLSKGAKGDTVRAMQILLIGNGYSCGTYGADGDFGKATDTVVRTFQRDYELEVDGIVGPKTWAKLLGL